MCEQAAHALVRMPPFLRPAISDLPRTRVAARETAYVQPDLDDNPRRAQRHHAYRRPCAWPMRRRTRNRPRLREQDAPERQRTIRSLLMALANLSTEHQRISAE
jgi:hypothetical protein